MTIDKSHENVNPQSPQQFHGDPQGGATYPSAKLTIFQNSNGRPLSKSFSLNGKSLKSERMPVMSVGSYQTLEFDSIEDFADALLRGSTDQAICFGVCRHFKKGKIAAKDIIENGNAPEGAIERSGSNFVFDNGPGFLFLDFDMLPGFEHRRPEHLEEILAKVVPWLARVKHFYIPSASSEIYIPGFGEPISKKFSYHAYWLIEDASFVPAAGRACFASLVEAGHGHIVPSKSGIPLLRTLIDDAVWQPERLDFAFGAHLGRGLQQRRQPQWIDGAASLEPADIPKIDYDKWRTESKTIAALKRTAEPTCAEIRRSWLSERVNDAVSRGMPADEARQTYGRAATAMELTERIALHLVDGSAATVADLLDNPERYHGMTMGDPLEPDYGGGSRTVAKAFLIGQKVGPRIKSMAHGGIVYKLLRDLPPPLPLPEPNYKKKLNGHTPPPMPVVPKPIQLIVRPESQIPRRDFLYGDHYIRGYVSMTAAPGGTGKTAVAIGEALAMATKRAILSLNVKAGKILRVWYLGEDDKEELERRFAAAMKLHGIADFEVQTLFVNSLDDLSLIVYDGDETPAMPPDQTRQQLIRHILDCEIDVVIVDPFADTHAIDENRNNLVGKAILAWRQVARGGRCAVELITHTRKPVPGVPASVEDTRGGRAQIDRARHGRILIRMTEAEATAMRIEETDAFRYVRFGTPKANMAPSQAGEWMRLESVWLENGIPNVCKNDNVQVAAYWRAPTTFENIPFLQIDMVMREIQTGEYKKHWHAENWAGLMVCEKMGLPLTKAGRKHAKDMLDAWERSGSIRVARRKKDNRHEASFYELGNWEFQVVDRG